jgi:hypothetical protein
VARRRAPLLAPVGPARTTAAPARAATTAAPEALAATIAAVRPATIAGVRPARALAARRAKAVVDRVVDPADLAEAPTTGVVVDRPRPGPDAGAAAGTSRP